MLQLSRYWALGKRLELHSAAPGATLMPLSCSPYFPRAQYLDIGTLTHELIVDYTDEIPIATFSYTLRRKEVSGWGKYSEL